jgi:hypothetical protein
VPERKDDDDVTQADFDRMWETGTPVDVVRRREFTNADRRAVTWYLWLYRFTAVLFLVSLVLLVLAVVMGDVTWYGLALPFVIGLVAHNNRMHLIRFRDTGWPWKRFPG